MKVFLVACELGDAGPAGLDPPPARACRRSACSSWPGARWPSSRSRAAGTTTPLPSCWRSWPWPRWSRAARSLSAAVGAVALQAKVLPGLLVAAWARRYRWWHFVVAALVAAALVIPYADAGSGLWHSATRYARYWRFNETLFAALRAVAGSEDAALYASSGLLLLVVGAGGVEADGDGGGRPRHGRRLAAPRRQRPALVRAVVPALPRAARQPAGPAVHGHGGPRLPRVPGLAVGRAVAGAVVGARAGVRALRRRGLAGAPAERRGERPPAGVRQGAAAGRGQDAPGPRARRRCGGPAVPRPRRGGDPPHRAAGRRVRAHLLLHAGRRRAGDRAHGCPASPWWRSRARTSASACRAPSTRRSPPARAGSPSSAPTCRRAAASTSRRPCGRWRNTTSCSGPTHDGGYYLIALDRPRPALFQSIPWSTPSVLPATAERAGVLGLGRAHARSAARHRHPRGPEGGVAAPASSSRRCAGRGAHRGPRTSVVAGALAAAAP